MNGNFLKGDWDYKCVVHPCSESSMRHILVGRRWHPCQGHWIRTRHFNKYATDVAVSEWCQEFQWDHSGGLFVYTEPEMTRNRNMSLNTGRSNWNSKVEQNQLYIVTVTAMNATPLLAEDACLSALCDVIIFKWWAWHVLNNAKYLGQDRATKMRQAYNEALLQRPDIPKLRCSGKIRAHTFVPKWWR